MAEVKKYKHLFFDLDHTLWDFISNSEETLTELYTSYDLYQLLKTDVGHFLNTYYRINEEKWDLYRKGSIDKETLRKERFLHTLQYYGCDNEELCVKLETEYIGNSPYKTTLIPGTIEVLDILKEKYTLHIITNGFNETQSIKIEKSGLKDYFEEIITSEMAGANKPAAAIFVESLQRAGAIRKESLMIGDNLIADIIGARNCGIDQVYFNPGNLSHSEKVTFEIKDLRELLLIL